MKFEKIVLIDHEPLTKRRKDIFMIDKFISYGYEFEFWNLSSLFDKNINYPDQIIIEHVFNINSIDSLYDMLSKTSIKNTLFIIECFNTWNTRHIFKLLSDFKCYTIKIDLYANTLLKESFFVKFKRIIVRNPIDFIRKCIFNISLYYYKKIYHIKSFDRVFSSSSLFFRTDKINHPDYEQYLIEKDKDPVLKQNYIVFCDIFFPNHPDLLRIYNNNVPNKEKYLKSLNSFFDYLEQKYNMPVVIAAHPKSDYLGNEFGNRQIIKYQTCNLVLNSSFVIQHFSNSVSFCLLADKPVVFIITDGMKALSSSMKYMKNLCTILHKEIFNIDSCNINKIEISKVKSDIALNYINTYLTSEESCNSTNIDILLRFITSIKR